MTHVCLRAILLGIVIAAETYAGHGEQGKCAASVATSTATASESQELAKKLQNPVAALISVPIQNNFDFKVGPDDGFRYTANFQPVVPLNLSAKWLLISRTILPLVHQSDAFAPQVDDTDIGAESGVYAGSGEQSGLGDVTQSFFFSPQSLFRVGSSLVSVQHSWFRRRRIGISVRESGALDQRQLH